MIFLFTTEKTKFSQQRKN